MKRKTISISPQDVIENDITIIKAQLGTVKNFSPPEKIVARCKWGYPQVTFVQNSKKKKEFIPGTLFWLTCPRVRDLISHIESEGFTQELQEEINDDKPLKSEILKSNDDFTKWVHENYLTNDEQFALWISANREKDIKKAVQVRFHNGGVSVPESIKCLHAHSSAYLGGVKDEVAKRAFEQVQKREKIQGDIEDLHLLDCPSNCIKCQSYDPEFKEEIKEKL
jgi:hypothetical protein